MLDVLLVLVRVVFLGTRKYMYRLSTGMPVLGAGVAQVPCAVHEMNKNCAICGGCTK